ncbi:hypothetical protein PTKIN_Ptkin08bG0143000 [Pterospermum kingtungense]
MLFAFHIQLKAMHLIRSQGPDFVKGLPDFRFETIPDGLPPSDRDATQDVPALCDSTRKNCLAPFLELVTKLNSSPQVPSAYQKFNFGLPQLVASWDINELLKRGIIPFQSENFLTDGILEAPIDWIPGISNICLKDIPSFIRANNIPDDIMFDFLRLEFENCLKAPAIILYTFDEFEHKVLEAIAAKFPRIYTARPLSLLARHMPYDSPTKSMNSSLWKEGTNCIQWLNKREPNSVVYVNYGSVTVMSEQHLKEFAWGLANCKHPFLWIVRHDVVMGDSAVLPEEFFEEIKDRGLITSWCSQSQVLSHPSVGVFLTLCGWNSTLEVICAGVPVICWPFFADQQTNCRYACTNWGIGMGVDHDVKRENIEFLVKAMMEGDKGKKMKEKALGWKKKAEAATGVGGSSYNNFDRFVKEALHHG